MDQRMDKLKLFEITYYKVASDKDFVAYYLEQISRIEDKTQEQIVTYLDCSRVNFYKLGLSKVPDPVSSDYGQRLANICGFAGIKPNKLNYILLQVNAYDAINVKAERETLEQFIFAGWKKSENRFVRKIVHTSVDLENAFTSIKTRIPPGAYRAGLAMVAVLFTLFISNTRVDEKSFYTAAKTSYKESVKHLAVNDNTSVYKIPFKKV